jgi:hypothetical protein
VNGPPVWVAELAGRFWADAGEVPFPRDVAAVAQLALPVRVVNLPGLTVAAVRAWLTRLKLPCPADEPDRPLRACLQAYRGTGVVFLDAADPPNERRFSAAHEVAHFLRDYLAPRAAAERRFGAAVVEVLDGKRGPSAAERLRAAVLGRAVAAHVHLLSRDDAGRPRTPAEREAEAAADRLAFELLAPAALLRDIAPARLSAELVGRFGLPPAQAAEYAAILHPPPPADPLVRRWAGLRGPEREPTPGSVPSPLVGEG